MIYVQDKINSRSCNMDRTDEGGMYGVQLEDEVILDKDKNLGLHKSAVDPIVFCCNGS